MGTAASRFTFHLPCGRWGVEVRRGGRVEGWMSRTGPSLLPRFHTSTLPPLRTSALPPTASSPAASARRLLGLAGDSLAALASDARGPFQRLPPARLLLPLRADRGQVVAEDVGRAAAVRAVDDDDGRVRERDARVLAGDGGVVPPLD